MHPILQFSLLLSLETTQRLLPVTSMYGIINLVQQAIILKFPGIIHISSEAEMAFQNWLNAPVHKISNSDTNRTMMCTNCAQMKRQLDDALLQFKSLQKIIELRQW